MKTKSIWLVWECNKDKIGTSIYDVCLTKEAANEAVKIGNKYHFRSKFIIIEVAAHD